MMDKTNDAIALWQQMVGDMQKGFSAFTEQVSAASGSRKSADLGAEPAQPQLVDLMEDYCVSMNLPSRAQLNVMSERLQAIETQLSEIKALLRQPQMAAKPNRRPPRAKVRRPPKTSSAGAAETKNSST